MKSVQIVRTLELAGSVYESISPDHLDSYYLVDYVEDCLRTRQPETIPLIGSVVQRYTNPDELPSRLGVILRLQKETSDMIMELPTYNLQRWVDSYYRYSAIPAVRIQDKVLSSFTLEDGMRIVINNGLNRIYEGPETDLHQWIGHKTWCCGGEVIRVYKDGKLLLTVFAHEAFSHNTHLLMAELI